jgi:hypothetical protein
LSNSLVSSQLGKHDRKPIYQALRNYEQSMYRRSKEKVLKSKEAAIFLHSPSALAVANITRTAAAVAAQEMFKLNKDIAGIDGGVIENS